MFVANRLTIFFVIGIVVIAVHGIVVTSNGFEYITSWGEYGTDNGQFQDPTGIAIDSLNNIYVSSGYPSSDIQNQIQKFSADGQFIDRWGSVGSEPGQFIHPWGIAIDANDNIYVADTWNNRIQKFHPDGSFNLSWGEGLWIGDDPFLTPRGIAIDSQNFVYVSGGDDSVSANWCDHANRIYKFSEDGNLINYWGTRSDILNFIPGTFDQACDVVLDTFDNVYVADTNHHRVQKFLSDGTFVTSWGFEWEPGSEWEDIEGNLNVPYGIAIDSRNNIYVSSSGSHCIIKYTSDGQFLTRLGIQGTGPGQFITPLGIAIDVNDNLYVVDAGNQRIQKFSLSPVQVNSITPNTAISGSQNIPVTVLGTNFGPSATFKLVNATFGDSACVPTKFTRVSETELQGEISFIDAKPGLYDVVVMNPDGTSGRLEKGFTVNPIPVVIVHGWIGNPATMQIISNECKKDNPNVWVFDYALHARDNPQDIALGFGTWLNAQEDPNKPGHPYAGRVDIVCYSMGALVTRWWMEEQDGGQNADRVRQWIGVAPVNQGAAVADYGIGFLDIAAECLGRAIGQGSLLQPAEIEMQTGSDTVTKLNANLRNPGTTYRIIVGYNRQHTSGNGFLKNFGGRSREFTGDVQGERQYRLTYWGDGVVANSQSELPWDAGTIDYFEGLSHTALPPSQTVAQTISAYLNNPDDTTPTTNRDPNSASVTPDGLLTFGNMAFRLYAGQSTSGRLTDNRGSIFGVAVSFYLPEGGSNNIRSVSAASSLFPLDVVLTSPSGRKIGPGTTGVGPNESYTIGQDMVWYHVDNAEQGPWTYTINHTGAVAQDVNVSVSIISNGVPGSGLLPLPGQVDTPRDLDANGKYEDVNGNLRRDFADVVLYFNQMGWIAANEPLPAFDYNGNGRIDFADVVWLFNHL